MCVLPHLDPLLMFCTGTHERFVDELLLLISILELSLHFRSKELFDAPTAFDLNLSSSQVWHLARCTPPDGISIQQDKVDSTAFAMYEGMYKQEPQIVSGAPSNVVASVRCTNARSHRDASAPAPVNIVCAGYVR